MSYNITDFKVNDQSASLGGFDFRIDEYSDSNRPASCKNVYDMYKKINHFGIILSNSMITVDYENRIINLGNTFYILSHNKSFYINNDDYDIDLTNIKVPNDMKYRMKFIFNINTFQFYFKNDIDNITEEESVLSFISLCSNSNNGDIRDIQMYSNFKRIKDKNTYTMTLEELSNIYLGVISNAGNRLRFKCVFQNVFRIDISSLPN